MPVMVSNIKFLLSDLLCHGLLLGFLVLCISPNSNMEKNANIFVIAALDLLHISGFSFVASQLESTGRAFSFEVEKPHCWQKKIKWR